MENLLVQDQFDKIVQEYYNHIIRNNANGYSSMKRAVYDINISSDNTLLAILLIHAFNTWKESLNTLSEKELERLEKIDPMLLDAIEYYSSQEDIANIKELKTLIAQDSNYNLFIKNHLEPISIGDNFEIVTSFKDVDYNAVIIIPKFSLVNIQIYKDLIVELISKDLPVVMEQNILYLNDKILAEVMKIIVKLDNVYDNILLYNSNKIPFCESYDCMNIAHTDNFDEYIETRVKALEHALILAIKYQLSEAIKIYEIKDNVDDKKVELIHAFCKMIKDDISKLKNDLMYQEMERKKELGAEYTATEKYIEMEDIYKYPTKFKKSVDEYIDSVFKSILVPESINEDNVLMYEGRKLDYFTTSQIKYIRYIIPLFMEISPIDLYNKFESIFELRMKKYGIEKIGQGKRKISDEKTNNEGDSKLNITSTDSDIILEEDNSLEEIKAEIIEIDCSGLIVKLEIIFEKNIIVDNKEHTVIKFNAYEIAEQGEAEIDICSNCYIAIDKRILYDKSEICNRIKIVIANRLLDEQKMRETIRQRAGFVGVFEFDNESKQLRTYSNMEIIEKIKKGEI